MSDYLVNLKQDWNDLIEEIGELLKEHPELTVTEIEEITGADYEDVLWAVSKVD